MTMGSHFGFIVYITLRLESWDFSRRFFGYRLLKMVQRTPWYDFTSAVAISRADVVFLWAIQNRRGLGVVSGRKATLKIVSNIQSDIMEAKGFFDSLIELVGCGVGKRNQSHRYRFWVGQGCTYFSAVRIFVITDSMAQLRIYLAVREMSWFYMNRIFKTLIGKVKHRTLFWDIQIPNTLFNNFYFFLPM
jgi:hypothetical protein